MVCGEKVSFDVSGVARVGSSSLVIDGRGGVTSSFGILNLEVRVDVDPGSLPGLDRQLLSCVSAVFLCHFVGLVFACILGLILVPIRLGLAGIGFSKIR